MLQADMKTMPYRCLQKFFNAKNDRIETLLNIPKFLVLQRYRQLFLCYPSLIYSFLCLPAKLKSLKG